MIILKKISRNLPWLSSGFIGAMTLSMSLAGGVYLFKEVGGEENLFVWSEGYEFTD